MAPAKIMVAPLPPNANPRTAPGQRRMKWKRGRRRWREEEVKKCFPLSLDSV